MFEQNTQFEHVMFRGCRGSVLPSLDSMRSGDRLTHKHPWQIEKNSMKVSGKRSTMEHVFRSYG